MGPGIERESRLAAAHLRVTETGVPDSYDVLQKRERDRTIQLGKLERIAPGVWKAHKVNNNGMSFVSIGIYQTGWGAVCALMGAEQEIDH